ncbi:hypothetical protein LWM68_17645 [Niabella sp. W65]|nr:hypothetical protein [Niabella sp. W65]MCH7364412.1 hypothetical protein [Niabella sp. W65]
MAKILYQFFLWSIICLAASSCKKDYYIDTGVNEARFDGTIMEYLEKDPFTLIPWCVLSSMPAWNLFCKMIRLLFCASGSVF